MITFKQLMETVDELNSEDEQNFRDKHVIQKKDHPVADDDQFVADLDKDMSRSADYEDDEDEEVYEEVDLEEGKMSQIAADFDDHVPYEEMSKTYKIPVESIKKMAKEYFARKSGGGRARSPFPQGKKSFKEWIELDEAEKGFGGPGTMKLKDGSTVKISKEDSSALTALFNELAGENRKKMHETMMANKKGYDEILKFAKEVH